MSVNVVCWPRVALFPEPELGCVLYKCSGCGCEVWVRPGDQLITGAKFYCLPCGREEYRPGDPIWVMDGPQTPERRAKARQMLEGD